jgi:hypothetical protein
MLVLAWKKGHFIKVEYNSLKWLLFDKSCTAVEWELIFTIFICKKFSKNIKERSYCSCDFVA